MLTREFAFGVLEKRCFLGSSLKWNANVSARCEEPQRKIAFLEPSFGDNAAKHQRLRL